MPEATITEIADLMEGGTSPRVEEATRRIVALLEREVPIGPDGFSRREGCCLFSALCVGAFQALWSDCDAEEWAQLMSASQLLVERVFAQTIKGGQRAHADPRGTIDA
jgi:hypothetical protein